MNLEAWIVAGCNLAFAIAAYGSLRTQVARLVQDRRDDLMKIEAIQKGHTEHRLELREQYVTLEAFRELRREMREGQADTTKKLERLLEMVGKLHGQSPPG